MKINKIKKLLLSKEISIIPKRNIIPIIILMKLTLVFFISLSYAAVI
jgi:hypothetical protein